MVNQQAKVATLQNQIASGAMVNSATDDPVAFSGINALNQRLIRTQTYQKNNQTITNNLNNEDSVLGSVSTTIQALQGVQLQSGNASLTDADRKSLAIQAQGLLNQLRDLANSTDINGNYMFGGSKGTTAPINSTYNYIGDSKQQFQAISDNQQIATNDTGDSIFMNIPGGNGSFAISQTANPNGGAVSASLGSVTDPANYVPGQYSLSITGNVVSVTDSSSNVVYNAPYQSGADVTFNGMTINLSGAAADGQTFSINSGQKNSIFSTVQQMINSLNLPSDSSANQALIQTQNNQVTSQLSSALNNVSSYRSTVGLRVNQLDTASTTNTNLSLIAQTTIQQMEGSDATSQISMATQYTLQIQTLQAAQQSFTRLSGMSLFNYL
jgi:flagellar hook-associated protein 3 FlgL